jgi:NADH-quinone oxidoreductase subunit N
VIATFAVVTLVGGRGDELHSIDHYRGLARRQPWLGGALTVLLLSQLGAPLTVGFYAKYTVLAATIDSGGGALALVAIITAAIAAYFYLRWAMWLYADDDVEATRVAVPTSTGVVIGVGVIVAILFGLWPGPLVAWCQHATLLFLP